ncbi:MAG: cupin domain-containing protein [Thermogutta sp.]
MKVVAAESIEPQKVVIEGAAGCTMRVLIGPDDRAPNFTMRQFEVEAGGHTPLHAHPYEHEVYVLEGEGMVMRDGEPLPLRPGMVVFVPANVMHQFRAGERSALKFLCLIPNAMRGGAISCVAACSCD